MFKKFIAEIKARKVRKWFAIHISTSLTVFGAVNLIGNRYGFPPVIFDSVFIFSLCSLPVVLVLAWNHTSDVKRKFKTGETVFYTLMVVVTVFLLINRIFITQEEIIELVEKSIAVLPFQNFSDSKDDEYFSDGVTEDILTQLSKIRDLKVVSRTSVMKYKNTDKSIREIAKELGVENILEGSVRRSGDRIRIVSQLIDARNDQHLWAETYDKDLTDIFKIQSEVAQNIAMALRIRLSPEEKDRIEKKSTDNIEAYTYYLKGREYYKLFKEDANETAIDFFKKAIDLDPVFAAAYSNLAMAYAQKFRIFGAGSQWSDSSRIISEKAIEIDPDIAEPYIALGMNYLYNGKLHLALEQAYKAVNLNPNSSAAGDVGQLNYLLGNYPEAIPWLERAIKVDPTNWTWYRNLGLVKMRLFKFDEAEGFFCKVRDLMPEHTLIFPNFTELYIITNQFEKADSMLHIQLLLHPNNSRILFCIGQLRLFEGNFSEAMTFIKRAVEISSLEFGPAAEYAFLLNKAGQKEEAQKILNHIITINKKEIEQGMENYNYPYELVRTFSIMNIKESALYYLNIAIKNGWRAYPFTLSDPLLENIKSTPEFTQIMESLKKEIDRMAAKLD
jgi:TolB-like protein